MNPPLGELGWRGVHNYDSPGVVALRERLDSTAGIKGVELVDPNSEPDFAQRAAQLFHRDGFVLVKDCLSPERLEAIRAGCDKVIREMVKLDPQRLGNRGSHRYSFGHAPHHFGGAANWASTLVDPPRVLAVLEAIFDSADFHLHDLGGDFVLPGCTQYQQLHMDMRDFLHDPSGKLDFRDLPVPEVACNFPLEVVPGSSVGHTLHNGVTRQIPGTHNSRATIPEEQDEPQWMRLAVTAPVPAGSCLFRDHRAWHGGTPNLGRHVRAIPGSYWSAPWYRKQSGPAQTLIPKSCFARLSEQGQRVATPLASPTEDIVPLGSAATHVSTATSSALWAPDWDVEGGVGGGGEANAKHTGEVLPRLPPLRVSGEAKL
jgi:hypothetical protein